MNTLICAVVVALLTLVAAQSHPANWNTMSNDEQAAWTCQTIPGCVPILPSRVYVPVYRPGVRRQPDARRLER
jgi:hypothetical protein